MLQGLQGTEGATGPSVPRRCQRPALVLSGPGPCDPHQVAASPRRPGSDPAGSSAMSAPLCALGELGPPGQLGGAQPGSLRGSGPQARERAVAAPRPPRRGPPRSASPAASSGQRGSPRTERVRRAAGAAAPGGPGRTRDERTSDFSGWIRVSIPLPAGVAQRGSSKFPGIAASRVGALSVRSDCADPWGFRALKIL